MGLFLNFHFYIPTSLSPFHTTSFAICSTVTLTPQSYILRSILFMSLISKYVKFTFCGKITQVSSISTPRVNETLGFSLLYDLMLTTYMPRHTGHSTFLQKFFALICNFITFFPSLRLFLHIYTVCFHITLLTLFLVKPPQGCSCFHLMTSHQISIKVGFLDGDLVEL